MKLSVYKKLFEKEFELNIKPPKNFYSLIKNTKNKHSYPISMEKFYYKTPPIEVIEQENKLDVYVETNKIRTLYLSYLTLDTNFAQVPDETFINIDSIDHFYIDINIATSEGVEVIPFIIHYNNKGKKMMTRITQRNQLVEISDDETKIRLTFKIKGNGKFTIKKIASIK